MLLPSLEGSPLTLLFMWVRTFYFWPKLLTVIFQPFFCASALFPFLTEYFPSLPFSLGLFATGHNKPLYLRLQSFFWAKSITLTSYCFPPHLFHCMNPTLTQKCLLLVPEPSALHCVLFISILVLLLQY